MEPNQSDSNSICSDAVSPTNGQGNNGHPCVRGIHCDFVVDHSEDE
jgi:hypothetical protein